FLVEIGIGEQTQPDDARGIAVVGADRHVLRGSARAELDAGIFVCVGVRIGRAVGGLHALVEPEPPFARLGRLLETGFVDEAVVFPAIVPGERYPGLARRLAGGLVHALVFAVVFVFVPAVFVAGAVAGVGI